jgi:undecaprenyl diphosphate synthase
MDGNGRWAEKHRKVRLSGHRAGAETLDNVMHYCREVGIKYLTVYAFSTENWKRSKEEVSGLMKLLSSFIKSKEKILIKERISFRVIGRKTDLSLKLQREIAALEKKTAGGDFTLVVALSYGGRAEIVDAAKAWALSAEKGELTEETFSKFLYAPDIPDPDLIIRTSGEQRISNFLLWELAYAEFYFTPVLWPDFNEKEFQKALADFELRHRRFGAV